VRCPICGEIFEAATGAFSVSPLLPQPTGRAAPPEPLSWDEDEAIFEETADTPALVHREPDPHHGPVILTFAILGLLTPGLGLIFGLLAWILGSYDLSEMRCGRRNSEGATLAVAGRLLGIVATVFHLLLLVLLILLPGVVP
jgi:hypothetical protein